MTYIPDGSPFDYNGRDKNVSESTPVEKWKPTDNFYAWGWLEDFVPQEKVGWESPKLKKAVIDWLKTLPKNHIVHYYCGYHTCRICGLKRGDSLAGGSNGSIRIKHNGKIYNCPQNVVHYIEEHDYNPGQEVLAALSKGTYFTYEDIDGKMHEEMEKEQEKMIEDENKKRLDQWNSLTKQEQDWALDRVAEKRATDLANAHKIKSLRKNGAFVKC